jgi:Asp-tRNA(Asn)/Glu-tRNA(Gln) amidotransferase C subunit
VCARFGALRGVDLGGVQPAVRAACDAGDLPTADADAAAAAHTRPDVPADFAATEEMLAAAPRRQAPYIYIPKILGEAEG